ncbi:related to RIB1 - GTP cyclohydrolase II [Pseudozyma flocculosa]|uniref:GTP cyclohydrolase II n=1 Tax=Pseudozyma flocculosa TaxID=84751 RepID=A0A5C3FCI3_9BASI|nr:related to RIB1 - GTP cyclohydrolase II [Pseudozyma flocculosa]
MQPRNSPAAHHSVAPGDLEVLDMLCSMPSSFPHSGPSNYASASSASKPRPLSTLNALRRPPIDPMVLAASLSSGPHVTRHHFHHSFGSGDEHAKQSTQMPASQRASLQKRDEQQPRSRKLSAASGSYANCDLDEFDSQPTSSAASATATQAAHHVVEPVPEVTDEERAMYASRQAPRSVRLQREREKLQSLQPSAAPSSATVTVPASGDAAATTTTAGAATPVAEAKRDEVKSAADIRASDEPARPDLERQPGNLAGKPMPMPVTANANANAVAKALDERKAAVVASATPSLGSLPAPGIVSAAPSIPSTPLNRPNISSIVRPPPLAVRCHARTRIPTPHGEIFCHLYRNNYDAKEHLALVIDPAQNDDDSVVLGQDGRPLKERSRRYRKRALRSKTLDEVWGPQESEMERIVRGAYVGRLGPSFQVPSLPVHRGRDGPAGADDDDDDDDDEEPPLVRIHSECYTGETIGSQRCDCGEQLDEAIRLISEGSAPAKASAGDSPSSHGHAHGRARARAPLPPRGVIVYLRQEGRGIGLLDKLMAYNLQDMGHDTVSANILLGHLPDARKYDIASAILRDLGVDECRLLTNNPEKMEALEAEGVHVSERVGMVPRVWKYRKFVRDKAKKKEKARARAAAAAAASKAKAKAKLGDDRPVRPRKGADGVEASPLRAALHHRRSDLFSAGGGLGGVPMDASMISQAASASEDDDPVSLGLRHQGEDVLLDSQYASASPSPSSSDDEDEEEEYINSVLRKSGATMIGGSITKSVELERYLRTKVERMGHLLTLPDGQVHDEAPAAGPGPGPGPGQADGEAEDVAEAMGGEAELVSQPNSEDEAA